MSECTEADYVEELEAHLMALHADLNGNSPDGGPNYAYAIGDLNALVEHAEALRRRLLTKMEEEHGREA